MHLILEMQCGNRSPDRVSVLEDLCVYFYLLVSRMKGGTMVKKTVFKSNSWVVGVLMVVYLYSKKKV